MNCMRSRRLTLKSDPTPCKINRTEPEHIITRIENTKTEFHLPESIIASEGIFAGDVEANNLSLLGDLTTTNANITQKLSSQKIKSDKINTKLLKAGNITSPCIHTAKLLSDCVETPQISSIIDLQLCAAPSFAVDIPNIRYRINQSNNHVISPCDLKSSKIFVVTTSVILQADCSCDGLEIIIYNNSGVDITIKDPKAITAISAKSARKLVYIAIAKKWLCL